MHQRENMHSSSFVDFIALLTKEAEKFRNSSLQRVPLFLIIQELFYFNCKLLYFRNKYSIDLVLEQKKGNWSLFVPKIWRSHTKYMVQVFMPKICRSHNKIYCAKNWKILCKNITKWRAPLLPFCCFCFFDRSNLF